jgi:hypothetical protein
LGSFLIDVDVNSVMVMPLRKHVLSFADDIIEKGDAIIEKCEGVVSV